MSDVLKAGLPFLKFEVLLARTHLPAAAVLEAAHIAPRTLARRKKEGRFTQQESEGLARLGRLHDLAAELFEGDAEAASAWLARPHRALGGRTPLDLAQTEVGGREVETLIGRLEHGVPS